MTEETVNHRLNELRRRRHNLERHLEERTLTLGDALGVQGLDFLEGVCVGDLLCWSPDIRDLVAARILLHAEIRVERRVGTLTREERRRIREAIRKHAPEALTYVGGAVYQEAA